ncbi:family 92 glycosyl hydrolase [Stachybotrys elegans]|uniref:Family 92 glycosyl hydrolase n=1 Tax=Stachybotrys elegans TaxID=80388 RepID=A0A8K0SVW4_9HYPO|nr:family 92 glycosyl hydrolase [Stachybotrys elegans]
MASPGRLLGARRPLNVLGLALLLTVVYVTSVRWLGPWDAEQPDGINIAASRSRDILKHVDPLIGTVNGGHVFPGATLPYGMAKAVADTKSPGENAAGFVSGDDLILGFSNLHDSGTGGAASLGNFPIFVHPGCPDDDYTKCVYRVSSRPVQRVKDSVVAKPGYFSIELENQVRAEMTATMHTNLYRFSFRDEGHVKRDGQDVPASELKTTRPLILVDLQDLGGSIRNGSVQVFPETGRIIGNGTWMPSFGQGRYSGHVCVDFSGGSIVNSGTFLGNNATHKQTYTDDLPQRSKNPSGSAGGWMQFELPRGDEILARVGLSFISTERACLNAEQEIPDFGFERTLGEAEDAWIDKLSVVQVEAEGISEEMQTTFWSGLYRSFLSPQNYTGENPLWDSSEPYFDSFYCIWDSYRAQHPLLTILDPAAQAEMVRSMIDIYRHEGFLPDCRMSFCKGFTQGGSNADVVIADALVKNITDGVDWETAYAALLADAEETPYLWTLEGRGNHESWEELNYIAHDHMDTRGSGPLSRTVSRTLEYAYNDYCVAAVAEALGHHQDAEKYLSRSGYWRNVWNPEQEDLMETDDGHTQVTDFVGFPQPRGMDGQFKFQSTRTCSPAENMDSCYFDTHLAFYEGSAWLYSFYAPQDMAGLIDVFGGADVFTQRLDYFHSSGVAYMGNEPTYLTVFQFHYAGRPGKSAEWVHNYIPSQFNASINGIPGNDDCAMGAFSSMVMMGFFPVAGQDVYLLTGPFFPEVRLESRRGTPAVIRKTGEMEGKYIHSAKLNGKRYNKSWISHDFFLNGGLLELEMGHEESPEWGTRPEDLPPSHAPGLAQRV